jgi:hypothetical protein
VIQAKDHEAARAIATRHLIVHQVEPEGGLSEPDIFEPTERLSELEAAIQSRGKTATSATRSSRKNRIWLILLWIGAALTAVAFVIWSRGGRHSQL